MTVPQLQIAVFVTVVFFCFAVYLFVQGRKNRREAALRKRLGNVQSDASLLKAEGKNVSSVARLVAESGVGWTQRTFTNYVVIAVVAGAVFGLVLGSLGVGVFFSALFASLIPLYLTRARRKRLELCDTQFPQALEVMSLALRAGHPLPTALGIAAAEAPQPIADELARAVDENELGRPVGDVLVALGDRNPQSESIHTFVVAVLVLQQTGGNLIGVIDRIVDNARSRAQYRAKLRALTSEGVSSARMLALMPLAFAVLAALADSRYIGVLFQTSTGNVLLLVALALWGLGILWTMRLTRVES